MTHLTPERLAEIRERVEFLTGALPENGNGRDSAALLAEVDSLRSVLNNVREYAEYRFPYSGICRDVLDLLDGEDTP